MKVRVIWIVDWMSFFAFFLLHLIWNIIKYYCQLFFLCFVETNANSTGYYTSWDNTSINVIFLVIRKFRLRNKNTVCKCNNIGKHLRHVFHRIFSCLIQETIWFIYESINWKRFSHVEMNQSILQGSIETMEIFLDFHI